MSIAEKKLIAIEKLSKLNSETAINEVLEYIKELESKEMPKQYNLASQFESINAQYGETLKKLAE